MKGSLQGFADAIKFCHGIESKAKDNFLEKHSKQKVFSNQSFDEVMEQEVNKVKQKWNDFKDYEFSLYMGDYTITKSKIFFPQGLKARFHKSDYLYFDISYDFQMFSRVLKDLVVGQGLVVSFVTTGYTFKRPKVGYYEDPKNEIIVNAEAKMIREPNFIEAIFFPKEDFIPILM